MPELKLLCYFKDNSLNLVEGQMTLVTGYKNKDTGDGSVVYSLKHIGSIFASIIVKPDDVSFRLLSTNTLIDYQKSVENIMPALLKQIK